MKHIKKKTVEHFKIKEERLSNSSLSNAELNPFFNLKYKDIKGKNAIVVFENGETFRAFFYNHKGNACAIPLANPVLIYFHNAQTSLTNIYTVKEELLNLFLNEKLLNEKSLNLFYNFFGMCSSFIVMLMTAMEAFVNQTIPNEFIYKKDEGNKFTKSYNKGQIERWIPLEEKITEILNKEKNKNFAKKYSNRQIFIDNLKQLRDDIVHTKKGNAYEKYEELFVKTLNFKYTESIEAVKDFINFYEGNLIEPCLCGVDF